MVPIHWSIKMCTEKIDFTLTKICPYPGWYFLPLSLQHHPQSVHSFCAMCIVQWCCISEGGNFSQTQNGCPHYHSLNMLNGPWFVVFKYQSDINIIVLSRKLFGNYCRAKVSNYVMNNLSWLVGLCQCSDKCVSLLKLLTILSCNAIFVPQTQFCEKKTNFDAIWNRYFDVLWIKNVISVTHVRTVTRTSRGCALEALG